MKRSLFCLLVLSIAVPVCAEEPQSTKETNLGEICVTAARTEQSIADAPGSVSIVTTDEMQKRNIQSVDQALTLLPGVFDTRSKGPMATTTAVTLRGIPTQGRTLIMMDGMPLNDGYSSSVQYGGLYAQDLQKIEVVRGPSSSLYGSSAMGGVVNLMTVMPCKREFTFDAGYGTGIPDGHSLDNLWSTHASYGDKIGKLSLYTALGYKSTAGYPTGLDVVSSKPTAGLTGYTITTNNTGAIRYLIGDTGNNGWWDYTAAFRTQYDFSDTTNLRFSYLRAAYKYTYDSPHTYLFNSSGSPVYSYGSVSQSTFLSGDGSQTQDTYAISAETLLGSIKGKATIGINNQGDSWYITPTSGVATLVGGAGKLTETPKTTYYTDLQLSAPIMEKHILTGGVTFRNDHADTSDTPLANWKDENSKFGAPTYWAGGANTTYSAYLQAEIALLNSLTLYAGVRDDYWVSSDGYAGQSGAGSFLSFYPKRSQNAVSPKGALVWKPVDGTVLRISGGKAFNAPNVYQMFRTWESVAGTTTTIYNGNPYLSPETVLSWDAGIEQKLWSGAKAKATYFENHLSDLIYLVTTSTTTNTINKIYTNVGDGVSRGTELELEQSFGNYLRLFASYTYTDSYVSSYSPNPAIVGKQLTQVPRQMFNAGADASYGPASLLVTGRYVSKRFGNDDNSDIVNNVFGSYDPYFLIDTKAAYKVTDWATASFSVDNLLDRRYFNYYVAPGRSFFANLAMKF